jgi:hypothetical protein
MVSDDFESAQKRAHSIKIDRANVPPCEDCGGHVGLDRGPPDGWQLEDGRTVCHSCCLNDFGKLIDKINNKTIH